MQERQGVPVEMPAKKLMLAGELDQALVRLVNDLFLPVVRAERANKLKSDLHVALAPQSTDLVSRGLQTRENSDVR